MHEEVTIPELTEVVARWPPSSVRARVPSRPSTAGSRTATSACGSGAPTTWCGCRARTPRCSGSTARRSRREQAAAELGIAPAGGGVARGPALPRHVLHQRPRADRRGAARAGHARRGGRGAAALPRLGPRAAHRVRLVPVVEEYASSRARARRGAAARVRGRARGAGDPRSRGGTRGAHAGALPRRPPHRQLPLRRRATSGSWTGSTRAWATATSTSATSRSTTSSTTSDEERLLEAYFGEPATGTPQRAALALFRYMSDFREAMWGVVQSAVSDIDFDFEGYARKHFDAARRSRADPRFDGPAPGGPCRRPVSCRARTRCLIIGGGVGGTSIAYHLTSSAGATWCWWTATSSPPARPSTPPGSWASCAARCRSRR